MLSSAASWHETDMLAVKHFDEAIAQNETAAEASAQAHVDVKKRCSTLDDDNTAWGDCAARVDDHVASILEHSAKMLGGAAEEKAASIEIHSKLHKCALDEIVPNHRSATEEMKSARSQSKTAKEQIEDKGATSISSYVRYGTSRAMREDSAQMTSDTKSIQSATTSMSSSKKTLCCV